MYNIHPTDFLIFSFDREVSQSKVLFQYPRNDGFRLYVICHLICCIIASRFPHHGKS